MSKADKLVLVVNRAVLCFMLPFTLIVCYTIFACSCKSTCIQEHVVVLLQKYMCTFLAVIASVPTMS